MINKNSVLFITLDSCRYDSFCEANAPNLRNIGPLYRAQSPSHFTFGSHAAFFMGFTPGIANCPQPYVNPKYSKIFQMTHAGFSGVADGYFQLEGQNIIDGFKRCGYFTIGSGAVGWFNPTIETGRILSKDFNAFFYAGNCSSLALQLLWLKKQIHLNKDRPLFVFINIGETHVPYYFSGADWSPDYNPCIPFAANNDALECRRRQIACIEFIDASLKDLLDQFSQANLLVCADHGDVWGEDGLWEHGIHHQKTIEVPLLFHLPKGWAHEHSYQSNHPHTLPVTNESLIKPAENPVLVEK